MKKLILGTIFFVATMISYAEIKDELNLFKDTEKAEMQEKIEALKGEFGTTIYVTTLPTGETFIPAVMEKVIVINFNKEKDSSDKISVQLKFTPDLNMENKEDEINEILESSAHLIEAEKNSEYTLALLEGMKETFKEKSEETSEIETSDVSEAEEPQEEVKIEEQSEEQNQQPIEVVETIIEESVPEKETDYKKYIIGAMAAVVVLGAVKITANARRIAEKNKKKRKQS